MFAVVVTFKLKPEAKDKFLTLMRENATASVRDEPGCHQFDVATDPDRPDEVFLYELYTDSMAFEEHKQTTHFALFDDATSAMIAEKQVQTYRTVAQ